MYMQVQGTHGTGKTGKTWKMANKNSLQGKLREFENFAKFRENAGNFNLRFFLICWSSCSWTMICNACMCSGKFNVLTVFLPKFSRADINNIFTVIMRVSHHGTLQLGHVGWVKVSHLTISISGNSRENQGKTQGKLREFWNGFPVGTLKYDPRPYIEILNFRSKWTVYWALLL